MKAERVPLRSSEGAEGGYASAFADRSWLRPTKVESDSTKVGGFRAPSLKLWKRKIPTKVVEKQRTFARGASLKSM